MVFRGYVNVDLLRLVFNFITLLLVHGRSVYTIIYSRY